MATTNNIKRRTRRRKGKGRGGRGGVGIGKVVIAGKGASFKPKEPSSILEPHMLEGKNLLPNLYLASTRHAVVNIHI